MNAELKSGLPHARAEVIRLNGLGKDTKYFDPTRTVSIESKDFAIRVQKASVQALGGANQEMEEYFSIVRKRPGNKSKG
jgi:hypothetical protein